MSSGLSFRTWCPYDRCVYGMSCCRWTTPFGRPVEPEEYIQKAMSLRCVSAADSRSENIESHERAHMTAMVPLPLASPLTTISDLSCVPAYTAQSKRSRKADSTTAALAPESLR